MIKGTPIRELCQKHKLTQRDLSTKFGIPLRTVEDWASGKHKCPEYVVKMLCMILSMDERAARMCSID